MGNAWRRESLMVPSGKLWVFSAPCFRCGQLGIGIESTTLP